MVSPSRAGKVTNPPWSRGWVPSSAPQPPVWTLLAEALARVGVPAEAVTLVDQSENWWTPEAVRV